MPSLTQQSLFISLFGIICIKDDQMRDDLANNAGRVAVSGSICFVVMKAVQIETIAYGVHETKKNTSKQIYL